MKNTNYEGLDEALKQFADINEAIEYYSYAPNMLTQVAEFYLDNKQYEETRKFLDKAKGLNKPALKDKPPYHGKRKSTQEEVKKRHDRHENAVKLGKKFIELEERLRIAIASDKPKSI